MGAYTTALTPIITLILIGYILKQTRFLPEQTWPGIEKLTYYVLFPALLIRNLGNQSIEGSPWFSMLLVVVGTLLITTILVIVWYKIASVVSATTFTSIFQGSIRFNTYIALAVVQSLFGQQGLVLGSVTAGFMIIVINVLCISAFSIWGNSTDKGIRPFLREVLYNPLIISCTIGWLLSLSNVGVPVLIDGILEIVGRAALPFGLLAVGAALKLDKLRGHIQSVAISTVTQFGLKPLIASILIASIGLTDVAAAVLVISFIVPTATSSYILARQLGGDTEVMASIITFQTLVAFVLMPVLASVLLK